MLTIDDIEQNFAFIDDWEERYRYVIELGRELTPLPEDAHSEQNRVKGCASQVWLQTDISHRDGKPVLHFTGDSDAHIVRGLIAVVLALYSDQPADEILRRDVAALFARLGLDTHLTPQRSNGVKAMVERIKRDATEALASA